jgi:hypothetical protein
MKELKIKPKTATIEQLIDQALADIGADRIPIPARQSMSTDVLSVCAALIRKRITGEYVGRMVAASLTAATEEGSEGERSSPSASQPMRKRSAQMGVAGPAINSLMAHDGEGEARRPQSQDQGGVA